MSGHRVSALTIQLTDKLAGKIVDTRQVDLSPDLKTLTMTVRTMNHNKSNTLVFERENRDLSARFLRPALLVVLDADGFQLSSHQLNAGCGYDLNAPILFAAINNIKYRGSFPWGDRSRVSKTAHDF